MCYLAHGRNSAKQIIVAISRRCHDDINENMWGASPPNQVYKPSYRNLRPGPPAKYFSNPQNPRKHLKMSWQRRLICYTNLHGEISTGDILLAIFLPYTVLFIVVNKSINLAKAILHLLLILLPNLTDSL